MNIKHAWQRVVRGWDDTAVWSIDHFLAELIPQLVRELKAREHGIPISMFEEEDWDEKASAWKEGGTEKASKRWDAILDKIAEGFEEYNELSLSLTADYWESEKFKQAFDLLKEHFGSLWW